ncbi:MAG TPA: hypothetical protein VGH37_01350 [Candidatus Acidoferrum sp.]|jgi:hypothetical protein
MFELTAKQMKVVERLFEAGFRPIAIPPYERALCMHRGDCAALLAPVENGGLQLLAAPTFLVNGNVSVRIKRGNSEVFVFKKDELPATPERLKELEAFRTELVGILEFGAKQ